METEKERIREKEADKLWAARYVMGTLNKMCENCSTQGCPGTTCQDWTGCIYKKKA